MWAVSVPRGGEAAKAGARVGKLWIAAESADMTKRTLLTIAWPLFPALLVGVIWAAIRWNGPSSKASETEAAVLACLPDANGCRVNWARTRVEARTKFVFRLHKGLRSMDETVDLASNSSLAKEVLYKVAKARGSASESMMLYEGMPLFDRAAMPEALNGTEISVSLLDIGGSKRSVAVMRVQSDPPSRILYARIEPEGGASWWPEEPANPVCAVLVGACLAASFLLWIRARKRTRVVAAHEAPRGDEPPGSAGSG